MLQYQNVKKEYKDYVKILDDKKKNPQQKLQEIIQIAGKKRDPKDNNPFSITVVGAPLHRMLSEIDPKQPFEKSEIDKEYSETNAQEIKRAQKYLNAVLDVIQSPSNKNSLSYDEFFAPYAQIVLENEEHLDDINVLNDIIKQWKAMAASFEKEHKSHSDIHRAIAKIDLTKDMKESELAKYLPAKKSAKSDRSASYDPRTFGTERRAVTEPARKPEKTALKDSRAVTDPTSNRLKKKCQAWQ